jgi:glycosyltransferase involved in cell wall biosynthesis
VFAYPSGFESFGIAFLEAWIRAKPVIGCRAGAIPSVIEDGWDGLLVRYEDKDELAHAVIRLLENPQMRRELGERGRQKTLRRYTWDIVSDRFREVYVQLMRKPL